MNETLHDHPRRDIPFHHYDTKQMKHPMMDRYSNPDPKIRDFESGVRICFITYANFHIN